MSEDVKQGELYLKFEKYIWKYSAVDSSTANIGMDTVTMILDSARADFPKPPATLFTGTTYQQQIETDGEYKNRVWLWYCKWFGEVP